MLTCTYTQAKNKNNLISKLRTKEPGDCSHSEKETFASRVIV